MNMKQSMMSKRTLRFMSIALTAALAALICAAEPAAESGFVFFVAADMRDYSAPKYRGPGYFLSACEAMKTLGGEFLVSPGDLDPAQSASEVIAQVFGPQFPWYPALGNHDLGKKDLAWLRAANAGGAKLPGVVRKGPPGAEETMYAFDHNDAHFVVINEYYDGLSDHARGGDISDAVYLWLSQDLAANVKPFVFVFGHEPAFPQPDIDTGKIRHGETSLNDNLEHRDRFWKLLAKHKVTAYICGHSHTTCAKKIDGVWQLDSGHARGKGDNSIPSTFLRIGVGGGEARFEIYRSDRAGVIYKLRLSGSLTKE